MLNNQFHKPLVTYIRVYDYVSPPPPPPPPISTDRALLTRTLTSAAVSLVIAGFRFNVTMLMNVAKFVRFVM